MNYQKIYDQIIERARSENREKGRGVYYEAHHIIPKCIGGTGRVKQWKTHPNIVLLTAREHFLCHWILQEMYPDNKKIALSFFMMCVVQNEKQTRYTISSRMIEYSKQKMASAKIGSKGFWTGKKLSEETKQKIREKKLGSKVHTLEWREQMSKRLKGKPTKRVKCNVCGKEGGAGPMHKYHFSNCKSLKT